MFTVKSPRHRRHLVESVFHFDVRTAIEQHFCNFSVAAFCCLEERRGAVAKLRIHISALIEGRGHCRHVTLANRFVKLIV